MQLYQRMLEVILFQFFIFFYYSLHISFLYFLFFIPFFVDLLCKFDEVLLFFFFKKKNGFIGFPTNYTVLDLMNLVLELHLYNSMNLWFYCVQIMYMADIEEAVRNRLCTYWKSHLSLIYRTWSKLCHLVIHLLIMSLIKKERKLHC